MKLVIVAGICIALYSAALFELLFGTGTAAFGFGLAGWFVERIGIGRATMNY